MRIHLAIAILAAAEGAPGGSAFAADLPLPPTAAVSSDAELATGGRREEASLKWLARLQLGLGSVVPSREEHVLALDGYPAKPKVVICGDFAWFVTPIVGMGAWGDFSYRWVTPAAGGPGLTESVYRFGAQVPLLITLSDVLVLLLAPRLGYGWSLLSLGGRPEGIGGIAYGGDLGLVWPKAHIAWSIGFLNGPTSRPGNVGRDSNLGGATFLLGGVIHG